MTGPLFLVTVETRNFQFQAVGATLEKALAALRRGWKFHCKQYDADPELIEEAIEEEEYDLVELYSGDVLRDDQLILRQGMEVKR